MAIHDKLHSLLTKKITLMKTITIKIQPQNIAGQNQPITFPL
jgi:hypothetical protein